MNRLFLAPLLLCMVTLSLLVGGITFAYAKNPAHPLVGIWFTEDRDGAIEIYPCGEEFCGRIYWLKEETPGKKLIDDKNPDPQKRGRPLCRMEFMGGFHLDEEGHYTDGWIYSPVHGAVFDAEITVVDRDTLDLRGFVVSPLLGESQVWKRAPKMPSCISNS